MEPPLGGDATGLVDYIRFGTRARLLRGEYVRWVENSDRRTYIRQVILSTPPWVDMTAIRALRDECRARSALYGQHVLAHIVPLNHPNVCGLTVPWNLRIEPWAKNAHEGNGWHDRQADLFTEPEQLEMWK